MESWTADFKTIGPGPLSVAWRYADESELPQTIGEDLIVCQ